MGINRTDDVYGVATARMHVVVSDRSVRKIGNGAFAESMNYVKVKVKAPFVEDLGERAFRWAYNLRHVTFGRDVASSRERSNFASPFRSLPLLLGLILTWEIGIFRDAMTLPTGS